MVGKETRGGIEGQNRGDEFVMNDRRKGNTEQIEVPMPQVSCSHPPSLAYCEDRRATREFQTLVLTQREFGRIS